MELTIEGKQIIGFTTQANGNETFHSVEATTGRPLEHVFTKATPGEVQHACELAGRAFTLYRKCSGAERAAFLEAIAEEIDSVGAFLVEVCCTETALAPGRIQGERQRTINQLKLFAQLLRDGSWVDARIDTSDSQRIPPRPDIRSMHMGIGPVAVFAASNFPLAFSVAGGDTASALAAGCPVIVKAHSAHPTTSDIVGNCIMRAAKRTNMPEGVFSMLHGDGAVVGLAIVRHPEIKAVGFTGSHTAGKAIFDAAVRRDNPIPVYAEMGSTNPVFVLPRAMRENKSKIALGFAASVTLGVGQFCTNPGLLLFLENEDSPSFLDVLRQEFSQTSGGAMLTSGIYQSYCRRISSHTAREQVKILSKGVPEGDANWANPILFLTSAKVLRTEPDLAEEVFGPASVMVKTSSKSELLQAARDLKGHLTATVHGTNEDLAEYHELMDILEQKVGRVIVNGFPTGVEVCHSMVHGGPYPATMDGRSTSVGTAAIYRFTRPVCFQGWPAFLLPEELKDENTMEIWRLVNGLRTRK